ncbi:MAG: lytic murein transglycosylase B [Betaproteobacteria bacterium]
MKRRSALGGLAALALAGAAPRVLAQSADGRPYPERPEMIEFLDGLEAATGVPRAWAERVLAQGRYSATAERLTTPSETPPPRDWREYRARNVDARRIEEGIAFARAHRRWLAQAEQRFGVPPAVIVAIIGIESFYGRNTGNFRTLDVLLTLAFDYPRRAPLYREQLAEFLLLVREQQLDPLALRGSFAGAIGLPQFLPASIRRYALDFDGDGRVDLATSQADAIGSVANYLAAQGWQRGLPIALPAQSDSGAAETYARGITAAWRWQDVAARDVRIAGDLAPATEVLMIDLPGTDAAGNAVVEYRVGTANLAAVLHYNRSYFYAAAVTDLAGAIARGL